MKKAISRKIKWKNLKVLINFDHPLDTGRKSYFASTHVGPDKISFFGQGITEQAALENLEYNILKAGDPESIEDFKDHVRRLKHELKFHKKKYKNVIKYLKELSRKAK